METLTPAAAVVPVYIGSTLLLLSLSLII